MTKTIWAIRYWFLAIGEICHVSVGQCFSTRGTLNELFQCLASPLDKKWAFIEMLKKLAVSRLGTTGLGPQHTQRLLQSFLTVFSSWLKHRNIWQSNTTF